MRKRNIAILGALAVLVSLTFCMSAIAQNAIENADEFVQKIVSKEEDESSMPASNSDSQIEWQDQDAASSDDSSSGDGQSH